MERNIRTLSRHVSTRAPFSLSRSALGLAEAALLPGRASRAHTYTSTLSPRSTSASRSSSCKFCPCWSGTAGFFTPKRPSSVRRTRSPPPTRVPGGPAQAVGPRTDNELPVPRSAQRRPPRAPALPVGRAACCGARVDVQLPFGVLAPARLPLSATDRPRSGHTNPPRARRAQCRLRGEGDGGLY